MKKTLTSIALAFFSLACFAAPPSDESIRTLLKVVKAESILDSLYANIEPAMRQAVVQAPAGKAPSEEQRVLMDRAVRRITEVMRSELSWEKMEPIQISIYRESFDQADVDALIEFYKSPVGQNFIKKMPVVAQKSLAATQVYMQQVMPRIKATMDEVLSESKLVPAK